jgi:Kdo2-lipid IVA lauroyltransferase/acyltransferase
MSIKFKHRLEYGVFQFFFQLTKLLPRRALLKLGRGIGSFAWNKLKFRRKVIIDNLTHAFGAEKDEAWILETAHDFYRNLGMTLMEFLAAGHRSSQDLLDNVVVEGREHVEELEARGSGAMMISGHFGNFELLLPRAAAEDMSVFGIAKPQSNKLIEKFQNDIRTREGVEIILTGGSFQRTLKALKSGGLVGLLGDQDAGKKGQFVEFMGRPASVSRGPATLAVKAECPILMAFLYRQPDYSHVLKIEPIIEIDPAWDEETAIRRLTEIHTAKLEEAVRRAPAMYYWVHRRWKSSPVQ